MLGLTGIQQFDIETVQWLRFCENHILEVYWSCLWLDTYWAWSYLMGDASDSSSPVSFWRKSCSCLRVRRDNYCMAVTETEFKQLSNKNNRWLVHAGVCMCVCVWMHIMFTGMRVCPHSSNHECLPACLPAYIYIYIYIFIYVTICLSACMCGGSAHLTLINCLKKLFVCVWLHTHVISKRRMGGYSGLHISDI